MRMRSGVCRHARAVRARPVHTAVPLAVVTALLLVGALGCGGQQGEQKSAGKQPAGDAKATAGAAPQERGPAGRTNRVHLTDRVCVHFEPHVTTLRVGESLTWQSELKKPVTIHVSRGAFDRTEFVVRAGETVATGPSRSQGSYSIWTEPAACQGIPPGVQGPGPGVIVEGAAQR